MTYSIAFLVRDDFFSKFGGDTFQIQKYSEALDSQGIKSVIYTLENFKTGDFIHNQYYIVNIDRGFECVLFYEIMKKRKLMNKTYVIPIHHDNFAVMNFNNARLGFFSPFIRSPGTLEKLKACVRAIRSKSYLYDSFRHLLIVPYKNATKCLLNEAKGIVAIAAGEIAVIERDYDVSIADKSTIIHNGVSDTYLTLLNQKKDNIRNIDVLVCGRIEQRKNQVAIAKLLANKSFNVKFVGGLNENNAKYCNEFLSIIDTTDNLEYIGKVGPEEMVVLYGSAWIHLSASWFEVSSLVDIEAFFAGCYVFSSKYGHSEELLNGERFESVDPYELSNLADRVEFILNSLKKQGESFNDIQNVRTWNHAGKELYEYIIKKI